MTRSEAAAAGCGLLLFFACAALSAAWSACEDCDDCDCPETPDRPPISEELKSLSIFGFQSIDGGLASRLDGGLSASGFLGAFPEGGTLRVTGDSVVITYRRDGADHRVVYEVLGPRW